MKKYILFLMIVATIVFMIFGKLSYGNKINGQVAEAISSTNSTDGEVHQKQEASFNVASMANLPYRIQKKLAGNNEVALTIISSGIDADYYASDVKDTIKGAYNSLISVEVVSLEGTSDTIIQSELYNTILKDKPDMVLWEVPLLEDNGVLSIEQTLDTVSIVKDELQGLDIQLVVQPTYPLYKAVNYPKQEQALQSFAQENQIPYLHHWNAWPDTNTVEFLDYVEKDQETPNERGKQVWSNAVIHYFVAE